jgi:hypothetical protein
MKLIAIDTMIFDLIADTPGLLAAIQEATARNALSIITTHIQRDQLMDIPALMAERREQLIAVYDAISKEEVPTRGWVLGISRLGGMRLSADPEPLNKVVRNACRTPEHIKDALIAVTADADADVLVTKDKTYANRVREVLPRCEVWNADQFQTFVLENE